MLRDFVRSLGGADLPDALRAGLVGRDVEIPGPEGANKILYADYAASGRALSQVESFIAEKVLPYYANSHTEASYCGAYMNRLRREAREAIAEACGANEDYAVIFTGAGATAGVNRIASLFMPENPADALVVIGPYEHHSNILPWRESGAEVIEIPESASGGPDLAELERTLNAAAGRHIIGSFSAASNVTGALSDVEAVTRLLKRYGALTVWDYAGGGSYLPIDMRPTIETAKDAVVISPHKFIGGPGASGLLIIRRSAVKSGRPSLPGGGTVSFVSPWAHAYLEDVIAREEAGTPNMVGDIRAALALTIKQALGDAWIAERQTALQERALAAWGRDPRIELLGKPDTPRLPIFSFRIRNRDGFIHHQLFTRMLSDFCGVQARGGCACAGPYAHRLLGIDRERSEALARAIEAGEEVEKPGWVRLNFSYLMTDDEADRLIAAVSHLARRAPSLAPFYACDQRTARFRYVGAEQECGQEVA